jgi:ubiquinol-cytochrome c reductase iron-sulfur subunit
MMKQDRRGFILGAFTGIGAVGALYAMKRTWDPLPSVQHAGVTTIELSDIKENELMIYKWRGKPIFVLKKTPDIVAKQSANDLARDIIVGEEHYMLCIGLCTHLGCIPAYRESQHIFLCACHGAEYDASAINIKAPAPLPMLIPPFNVKGMNLIIGEEGEAYAKMKKNKLLGLKKLDPYT